MRGAVRSEGARVDPLSTAAACDRTKAKGGMTLRLILSVARPCPRLTWHHPAAPGGYVALPWDPTETPTETHAGRGDSGDDL